MNATLRDPQAAAAHLADAAGLLRVNGHYNAGNHWEDAACRPWRPGIRLDIVGAVYVGMGVTTAQGIREATIHAGAPRCPDYDEAVDALIEHLGISGPGRHMRSDDALHAFWIWEDHTEVAQILAEMDECAARIRNAAPVQAVGA